MFGHGAKEASRDERERETERVKKQQKRGLHLEDKLSETNNWCQVSDIGRKQ